jgi:serine/threonine-protein kinase HipA
MRKAKVFVNNREAGMLIEIQFGGKYLFEYMEGYSGMPVSLTLPVSDKVYELSAFPPFFEGLLPEGYQLEGLLKYGKVDRNDLFAQLAGLSRETKYNYTMEKLVKLIDGFCTFPAVEKAKLFKRVIFNFLVGNEDMHLKNYSVITRNDKVELSPAYDLLNSSIVLKGDVEEIALPLKGKKSDLTPDILIGYFGRDRCGLTDKVIDRNLDEIRESLSRWFFLIDNSFLSPVMKEKYRLLLLDRIKVMGWG